MKILDRDGRLFGKISIIDVIVLLVVAVLAVAVFVKSQRTQTSTSITDTPVIYQMLLTNQPEYMRSAIQEGDQLYDQERSTGGSLGTITQVEVSDGTNLGALDDGTYAVLPAENRYNILITVEGAGLVSADGGVALNRVYDLGVNSSRTFTTQYASFIGTVTDIQIPEAETAQ